MSSETLDIFRALAAPFDQNEVKQFSKGGRSMKYVTARTVMNRLDDVLGPENWWDEFSPGEHSVICRLTIRLPDGTTLTKPDAGGFAGMSDEGDNDKSGFSDAFKRAAVKFGVGRYLYGDGVPRFARTNGRPAPPATRPTPPPAATPGPTPRPAQPAPQASRAAPEPQRFPEELKALPKSGNGAAYDWFETLGRFYGCDVSRKVRELAEHEGLSKRYREWDQPTLDRMARRAISYCKRLPHYARELDALDETKPSPDEQIAGARSALFLLASMLWRDRTGRPFQQTDIDQLVAEVSDGRIPDLQACTDVPLISAVCDSIRALVRVESPTKP